MLGLEMTLDLVFVHKIYLIKCVHGINFALFLQEFVQCKHDYVLAFWVEWPEHVVIPKSCRVAHTYLYFLTGGKNLGENMAGKCHGKLSWTSMAGRGSFFVDLQIIIIWRFQAEGHHLRLTSLQFIVSFN